MIDIIIKNKCYHPISTVIDGKTVRIQPKGKDLRIKVTKITDHLDELVKNNKIQVITVS